MSSSNVLRFPSQRERFHRKHAQNAKLETREKPEPATCSKCKSWQLPQAVAVKKATMLIAVLVTCPLCQARTNMVAL